MTSFRSNFTLQDVQNFNWEDVISVSEKKVCRVYSRLFFEKAEELSKEGNQSARDICVLLGMITSFTLSLHTPNDPYKPEWAFFAGERSAIPSDIDENYWEILLHIVPSVKDAEMRSRIADILWVTKRGTYQITQLAIDAYLESAQILEHPEHWVDGTIRVERALQLASQIDKSGQYFSKVIKFIESWLDKLNGEDPLWLSHKLMILMIGAKVGDTGKYAALAGKIATSAENSRYWSRAEAYWYVKSKWHERENAVEEKYNAQLCGAETHVSAANDFMNSQQANYMAAIRELSLAIEALRRISAPRERVNEIHALLLQCQEKSSSHMEHFSYSVDITNFVTSARDAVKGKNLRDAILFLAESYQPPSVDDLRGQVIKSKEESPFTWFITLQQVNEQGRVIATRPGVSFNDDKNTEEKAIKAEMYRQALYHQGLYAEAIVAPMIYQINLDNYISLDNLEEFVANNQFIPPGYEAIFARGLYAGLTGDFLIAAHLLIPQIENSLRYLLSQKDVITSHLNSQGIQEEYNLGDLLYKVPEIENILGTDLLFDLRGLLVERFGSNLRNVIAHGMLNANVFNSRQIIYFWWITLYLCCYPSFMEIDMNKEVTDDKKSDS